MSECKEPQCEERKMKRPGRSRKIKMAANAIKKGFGEVMRSSRAPISSSGLAELVLDCRAPPGECENRKPNQNTGGGGQNNMEKPFIRSGPSVKQRKILLSIKHTLYVNGICLTTH